LPGGLDAAAFDFLQLDGQSRLINQRQKAIHIANPADRLRRMGTSRFNLRHFAAVCEKVCAGF
jgi:hypothetical protein